MSMSLTKFQIFYITMVRMRLDLSFTYLAYQFKVHHSTISKYFHDCLFVLYSRVRSLTYWPERSTIKYTMPEVFQRSFQDQIVIIIDCFEVLIEQSSVLKTSSSTWSNYKHSHTVKYLIGMTPQGNFIRLLKMQNLSLFLGFPDYCDFRRFRGYISVIFSTINEGSGNWVPVKRR